MSLDKLLAPITVGQTVLPNRVWMAPLTRSRASQPGDIPSNLNATYYAQRASGGLLVTEATQVSRQGQGYAWTPGIYTDAQEAGWKTVVDAVHAKAGHISLQLWHVGRISHSLLQEGGVVPVAPSAIQAANSKSFVVLPDGTPSNETCETPRALATEELAGIVEQYRQGAKRAGRAGFDFVEVHAANGYLLNQFLATNSNVRTDAYGGSLENRARLVLEVVDAAIAELGANKVGVRLSPHGIFNDMADNETEAITLYLAKAFTERKIAYLHIAEPDWVGGPALSADFRAALRTAFPGTLVYCGGYTAQTADALIASGAADAIAFGRPFLANPDLVTRFSRGAALNMPDGSTFYGGAEKGYTDYPALAD